MKKILVLCNQTSRREVPPGIEYDEEIVINAIPPNDNLRLRIENITHQILTNLNSTSQDLLEIASYIYYADCSIRRGSDADVFGKNWKRKFEFFIPISNPDFWNGQEVNNLLKNAVEFLSGHEYSFTFLPPKPTPVQLYFDFPDKPQPFHGADLVSLFSGGLDSLVGSLYYLKNIGERPLLVSHRSRPNMDRKQRDLVTELKDKNQEWSFPHLSVWINRIGTRSVENTQRTRSFLYLSLAAAVAFQLGIRKIAVCENGIVSINIPISGQNIGTLMTRSTHPKFLKQFRDLTQNIFGDEVHIENPFIFNTKSQMLKMLGDLNQSELIQLAISCSYGQGRTQLKPQCGACFQCVNRRFSVISAGLEEHDRADFYEKDIFLDQLSEGRERSIALDYVRTAIELDSMDDRDFFRRFPELDEVISYIDMPSSESAEKIYELFRSHVHEVIEVIKSKYIKHQSEFLSGRLPNNCLISMTGRLDHLINPMDEYSEKIWNILNQPLRTNFRTRKPSREIEVQDAGEALLDAAKERLRRESPMLSFACVRTVPDFSNVPNYRNMLFVEFKFINSRVRLRQANTELTSRITIYTSQGASILFVVYDADNYIRNDGEYISEMEVNEKIKVRIVR
jgi:hypothetical protein